MMNSENNILRGPDSFVTLPPDLSLGQFLLDRLPSYEDKVALIDAETDEKLTFAQILDQSRRLAVYLSNNGLKKDDRIGICSENCLNFIIPICSSLYMGATICPLNPGYSRREFIHALNISKPVYIFVSESAIKTLHEIANELPWSPKLISMVESTIENVPIMSDMITSTILTNPERFECCKININDHLAAVMCSSGTTGLPKGVMLTDKNFLSITCSLIEMATGNFSPNSVSLGLLPFFHAYAFVMLVNQILLGVPVVVMPRFDPERFLSMIEKHKIQNLFLVPPLMVFLAKSPLVEKYDLSSVQRIWCGAAPLSPKIEQIVYERLNHPTIKQGYGMTETTLSVVAAGVDCKPGSIGKLTSNTFGKVIAVDGDGSEKPLGPGQEGELCFKGDRIMKGYCGDMKSTKATIDEDGWLHTGDVGYYDEDGFFYIVDRLKELIKYKGFQVPPAELEALLLTHPAVDDAAVLGLPDEMAGELPLAFVVKQPGSKITENDIIEYVNARVSSQKRLRGGVRFVTSIPKTASGKILRRLLREKLKSKL